MSSENKTFYIGVSGNIIRRILEHKSGKTPGFTKKYNLRKCVYYELSDSPYMRPVIIREKQLKNLSRKQKIDLISEKNPSFADISNELFSLVGDLSGIATIGQIQTPPLTPDKPE